MLKSCVGSVLILCLLFIGACALLLSKGSPCSDTAFLRSTAPDNSRTAIIVERECGATVNFIRQVVICDGVCSNGTDGAVVTDTEGLGLSRLSWENNNTLVVRYDKKDTKFFTKKSSYQNLVIRYVPLSPERMERRKVCEEIGD